MADSVQYALDRMIADLEDLRYRGIFSETEIRAIVAKRREFEYMLRRHQARKLDYLRYAEHELNLESLRALRTKRLDGGGSSGRKKKNKSNKKGAGAAADFSFVRLVRWIFDRAVMKFAGDVDLWLHYIDFSARQGQSKTLGRLFARALQLHPRNAGLWIKAASWEFFDGGNAASARALMQRGLRINPSAQNLWLQYFRLEFSYVEKIMGRREVLGLNDGGAGGDSGGLGVGATAASAAVAAGGGVDGDKGGRKSMDIPLLEGEEADQTSGPSFDAVKAAAAAEARGAGVSLAGDSGARPAPVMNETARRFYKGAVPLAVFRAAIKAVPDDVEFRAGFLRCCAADFPALGGEVARAVLDSIAQDFPESCEAWELRAAYPLLVAEGAGGSINGGGGGAGGGGDRTEAATKTGKGLGPVVQECVDIFEQAVSAVGSREPEMWLRYASFLRERLNVAQQGTQGRGRKRRDRGGGGGGSPGGGEISAPVAAAYALCLRGVLARAVEVHLNGSVERQPPLMLSSSGEDFTVQSITARKEGAKLATGGDAAAADDRASAVRRDEDAREALSAGLADVCLALGKPGSALEALRAATECLPRRAGPWLRRAALELRLASIGGEEGGTAAAAVAAVMTPPVATAVGGHNSGSVGGIASGKEEAEEKAKLRRGGGDGKGVGRGVATLRAGIESVPPCAPDYPSLWRELLACLVASGGGSKKTVSAAFRGAVKACDPSGADQGAAQGEFLAGYLRWSGAIEGADGARRAMQWAKRSFLLAGAGAAVAYNEAIELERAVGGAGSSAKEGGARKGKRVRELFEDAADKFGKKLPGIWEEYARFETQEGDVKRANAVRWRAQQQQQQQADGATKSGPSSTKRQRWG